MTGHDLGLAADGVCDVFICTAQCLLGKRGFDDNDDSDEEEEKKEEAEEE